MRRTLQLFVLLLCFGAVSAMAKHPKYEASAYKYIGVFEKGTAEQKMDSTMNLKTMRRIIRKRWSEGYDIDQIKYGNGRWIAVFKKGSAKSHQTYIVARRWEHVDLQLDAYWKEGYYMTDIEHGLAEWIVIFEKGTGYTGQSYERRRTLDGFSEAVKKRWKMGYDLIDIEYGELRYTGIFVKGAHNKGQALAIRSRWYDMAKKINRNWEEGYRIANIEQMLGRWVALFSKYSDEKAQGFETAENIEAFKALFEKRQKAGYILTDIAEGW